MWSRDVFRAYVVIVLLNIQRHHMHISLDLSGEPIYYTIKITLSDEGVPNSVEFGRRQRRDGLIYLSCRPRNQTKKKELSPSKFHGVWDTLAETEGAS